MKSQELRIGNIFMFEDDNLCMTTYGVVIVIKEKHGRWRSITDANRGYEQDDNYIDFEPIPLTPEILEKCGFKKRRDEEYLFSIDLDKHISIVVNKDNFFPMLLQDAEFSGGELNVYSCNLINYLHQLQNLYFALTGQELEVNL